MQDHAQIFLLCRNFLRHLLDGREIRDKIMLCCRLQIACSHFLEYGMEENVNSTTISVVQVSCYWFLWPEALFTGTRPRESYYSTTLVVEGFMEGIINICLWDIKQGRIWHSSCCWIWDRWGLLASNPYIWERSVSGGRMCITGGWGERQREAELLSQVKKNLIHCEQICLGHISAPLS